VREAPSEKAMGDDDADDLSVRATDGDRGAIDHKCIGLPSSVARARARTDDALTPAKRKNGESTVVDAIDRARDHARMRRGVERADDAVDDEPIARNDDASASAGRKSEDAEENPLEHGIKNRLRTIDAEMVRPAYLAYAKLRQELVTRGVAGEGRDGDGA